MTRSWAVKFATSGVRVNAVAPGPIYTERSQDELITALGSTAPVNRAGQPEEIAEVVGFLASPRLSYVTGPDFSADGGRTAV